MHDTAPKDSGCMISCPINTANEDTSELLNNWTNEKADSATRAEPESFRSADAFDAVLSFLQLQMIPTAA